MAKNNVDGVYNADPRKDESAVKYEKLSYLDVLKDGLEVMDSTASSLCMDNDIPLIVFSIMEEGNIKRAVIGESIGTIVRGNNVVKRSINTNKRTHGKAVAAYSRELASVRAGRANPSLLDKVTVEYYGAQTPLNQLSSINVPEARMLVVTPYDKTAIGDIEKAILKADLGVTPTSDGTIIRIAIPALTEERRKELVKVVKNTRKKRK